MRLGARAAKAVADIIVNKVAKAIGKNPEEVIGSIEATGKKLGEALAGGEVGKPPEAVQVTTGEIQAKMPEMRQLVESAKKETYAEIIFKKVERKANQHIPDIHKVLTAAQEGNIELPIAISKRLNQVGINVKPDDFLKEGATVESIKREIIKPHYERLAYLKVIDDVSSQLAHITTPEAAQSAFREALSSAKIKMEDTVDLNAFLQKTRTISGTDLRKVAGTMFSQLSAARSIQMNNISNALGVSAIEKLTLTFPDYVARVHAFAARNGLTEIAQKTKILYDHAISLDRLNARVSNIQAGISRDWKILEERGIDTNVRRYIESMDIERANTNSIFRTSDIFDDGIAIDPVAARTAGLLDDAGRPLFERDVYEAIVRTQNSFRLLRKMEHDLRTETFYSEHDTLPIAYDELSEAVVTARDGKPYHFSRKYPWTQERFVEPGFDSFGDYGYNYFPIKINEEHAKFIAERKAEAGYGDSVYDVQYAYQRMRRFDSLARIEENRLKPREELEHYFGPYMTSIMKQRGINLIQDMRKTVRVLDPLAVTDRKSNRNLEFMLDELEKFYTNMFRPTPNPYDMKQFSVITSAVSALTDLNTAMVLSPLNPRMLFFNTTQDLQTSAMYKPWNYILNSQKMYGEIAKIYIGGERKVDKFARLTTEERLKRGLIESIKDKEFREVVKYYFETRMPDVLFMDIYEPQPAIRKMLTWIGGPYQATDLISRSKALYAAWQFGKTEYEKVFRDGVAKDTVKLSKQKRELIDRLNLREFNEIDIDRLLSYVPNRQKFLNEYAALSTHYEMFGYSKFNKPYIAEMARTAHPVFGRMVRFLSWNTYYLNLIRGAYRAHLEGNNEPIKRLAAISALWWGTAATASGLDMETVNSWAEYGLGRIPFWSTALGLTTQGFNQAYGIAAPSIATMIYPAIKILDAVTDAVDGKGQDEIDRLESLVWRQFRYQPLVRMPENLYNIVFGE